MTKNQVHLRNSVLFLFLLAAAIYRICTPSMLPTWANFTPVGAMAIFSGTYFKPTWKAYILPIGILLLSDMVVNKILLNTYNPFYSGVWATYLAFILITWLGTKIKNVNLFSVLLASLSGVIIHWLITDIQPWLSSTPADGMFYYTKNLSGYLKSLYMAIPFEVNFLQGTLLFNCILFGAFEWLQKQYPALKTHTISTPFTTS